MALNEAGLFPGNADFNENHQRPVLPIYSYLGIEHPASGQPPTAEIAPVTELEDSRERQAGFTGLSYKAIGLGGLRKVAEVIRQTGSAATRVYDTGLVKINNGIFAAAEAVSAPERKTARRMAAGVCLGALAVGAAYAASRYGHNIHMGGNHAFGTAAHGTPLTAQHSVSEALQTHHQAAKAINQAPLPAARPHTAGADMARQSAKAAVKIKYYKEKLGFKGDTVWNHVRLDLRAKLGHDPSQALIRKITGRVLMDNHLNWQDATRLQVGRIIKIRGNYL